MSFRKKVIQGTREEVVHKLKVQLVSTIGTKGTLRGCSINEAISDFRYDWSEELQDYARHLGYITIQEMIEKELKTSVRLERTDQGVRFCAVASPDLEHCFRLIDKTQPKEKNRFASSLPGLNMVNFPPTFQPGASFGPSAQRFSRSQFRRPPASTTSGSVAKRGTRCLTPIYVRRKVSTEADNEKPSVFSNGTDCAAPSTSSNNNNSAIPTRRVSVAVCKEPWQVCKVEPEISSSYMKIYDSMTSKRRRKADPMRAEVELSRDMDAPFLDAVNREVYAKDDELNRSLDGHYFQSVESETSSEASETLLQTESAANSDNKTSIPAASAATSESSTLNSSPVESLPTVDDLVTLIFDNGNCVRLSEFKRIFRLQYNYDLTARKLCTILGVSSNIRNHIIAFESYVPKIFYTEKHINDPEITVLLQNVEPPHLKFEPDTVPTRIADFVENQYKKRTSVTSASSSHYQPTTTKQERGQSTARGAKSELSINLAQNFGVKKEIINKVNVPLKSPHSIRSTSASWNAPQLSSSCAKSTADLFPTVSSTSKASKRKTIGQRVSDGCSVVETVYDMVLAVEESSKEIKHSFEELDDLLAESLACDLKDLDIGDDVFE